ncbi:YEATS domain-containing protein 2 [Nylanderia fulva]|uniref:YEATS domain-containing protein 2 n=1 Tax=Nylanderia fulva TaxID=613905 RepID=UPI0010FB3ACE|nr:YEATS domain-containing protein 2 [Nylanderia fulva]
MSAPEESLNDQDPDYVSTISNDQVQQKIYEENARNTTARKITAIVEKEFGKEIELKEKEILQIQERLHKALKTFHLLRYLIITKFYDRKQCQIPQVAETSKQTRIHPAIKSLLGKYPKSVHCANLAVASTSTDPGLSCNDESLAPTAASSTLKTEENTDKHVLQGEKRKLPDEECRPRKVPRYIPPKSNVSTKAGPSRGNSRKVCKRFVIGNISKWIAPDWREDASSHKWTIYVRTDEGEINNISTFVSKVRFFLHPSYRPNDVIEVTSYPFHLSRRGWGEFPVRVQLHFKNVLDKPVDIIHHLKLDHTYTGLQTLGSETLVNIWIHTESSNFEQNDSNESIQSSFNNASIKIEPSNDNSFEFTRKQSTVKSMETTDEQMNTFEEIRVKEETINSETHEQSNLSSDLISPEKLRNVGVKVEFNNTTMNTCNNRNKSDLDETNYIKHDHNYVSRQYFDSDCYIERKGNTTIEHFLESDCAFATNSSAVGDKEEELDNVQITSRFNSDIQSSSSSQSLVISTVPENNLQVNAAFQERNSQKNLSSLDSNTSKIEENITTKDTSLTNDFRKPSDVSLERFNNLQKSANLSNTANSHLKPLEISIPPPNIFTAPTKKRMLLLDAKSIAMGMTNILSSKSNENSRKLVDGNVKLSIARDGNIAKLNVRIPQTVSILKKPSDMKTNPRQNGSDKKPAVLVLKNTNNFLLNVNENVPILKIADSRNPYNYNLAEATKGNVSSTIKQELMPKAEDKRVKITLGKDKYKIQSKQKLYEATLYSIDDVNIVDPEALIRFIIRRLPIITQDARDPEYKSIHPYACYSEEEYFAHNIGKQRALEWYRAKTIRRCFLRKAEKLIPSDQLWSVKEIMLWARLHGYTPSRKASGILETITKKLPDTTTSTAIPITCTESVALQKWLQTCQEESSYRLDACVEDEEIDVERIEQSSCETITIDRRKNDDNRTSDSSADSKLIPLELDQNLLPFHNFVCETARDIGIKIQSEEIVPGVLYSAASRVMMRVVECFVEDLTRMSLAKAWERNSENECPKVITVNDVRNALTSREEFDIFTNEGLGSIQQSSSTRKSSSL